MNHKEAIESLLKLEKPPAYVVLWHDGTRPQFVFGGDSVLAIGLTRYAEKTIQNYMAKRMPLIEVGPDLSKVVPGGNA